MSTLVLPRRTDLKSLVKGCFDHHSHACRWMTFRDEYFRHEGGIANFMDISLRAKQDSTGALHRGIAYSEECLYARMKSVFELKWRAGEAGVYAIVDCSDDIEGRAFEVALRLKKEFAAKGYTILVGVYSILGFREWGSKREQEIDRLAPRADFFVCLPERDDHPDHSMNALGHLYKMIALAIKYKKPLQIHAGQKDISAETDVEKIIAAVALLVNSSGIPLEDRPKISIVHATSTSCRDDDYLGEIVKGFRDNNIELIVCPVATSSTRRNRSFHDPSHNPIARVREFILGGVTVRIGTDNIDDIFVPWQDDPLLARELPVLANLLRFSHESVLRKIFTGEPFYSTDLAKIRASLAS